jgi:AcrR family transcriptional regulator
MARQRVDLRREEILAATITAVEANGLARTRVADVASALEVSPGLIFYHFATKDALLVAAFEYAVSQDLALLDEEVGRGADPTERLRRVLAVYGPTGAASGWRIWIDAWSLALRDQEIRTALRRLDGRWRQVLSDVLESGARDGSFSCADPSGAAARLGALIDGLSVASLVHGTVTRSQLRAWVREAAAAEVGLDARRLT